MHRKQRKSVRIKKKNLPIFAVINTDKGVFALFSAEKHENHRTFHFKIGQYCLFSEFKPIEMSETIPHLNWDF